MRAVEAFLLGILQGLTEFLPVSSKGHLVIGETLLALRLQSLTFEITVHLATLAAVIVVYRGRLLRLLRGHDLSYAAKLAVACVPVGVTGLLLKHRIEEVFHDPAITGVGLLFTGTVLFALRFRPRADAAEPSWGAALGVGFAQCLALLPGVSRSGMTIAAALVAGVAGPAAAEFSFLLSIPVIAAAAALQLLTETLDRELSGEALVIAFLAAFGSGIVALHLVHRVLIGRRFTDFAFYCWIAGALFLAYLALR